MNQYELKQTVVYLDNVSAGYPGKNGKPKTILKDISIVVKDVVRESVEATGQVIAIVGRSGRGKSTLFRVLSGLDKPQSGKILIANTHCAEPNAAKEVAEGDVGFVDQKYTLFRHKTVNQIMKYALKRATITEAEKVKMIDEQLIKWGLIEHKDKYPCELSGGQRQRTAIIEQLLTSKHFMIFDEPFSGLDVGNIQSVREAFNLISSSDELNTIIFSTHDLHLAVEMADIIFLIGHPEGVTDYSTIVQTYDLMEMGLAWSAHTHAHTELVDRIKIDMLKS